MPFLCPCGFKMGSKYSHEGASSKYPTPAWAPGSEIALLMRTQCAAPAAEVPLAGGHAKVKAACHQGASPRSYARLRLLQRFHLMGAMPRSRSPATEVPAQDPTPACTCYRGPICRGHAEVKATYRQGASPRSCARLRLLQWSHLPRTMPGSRPCRGQGYLPPR